MAGTDQQITSLSLESELWKRKEEEDDVKELRQEKEEVADKDEEDVEVCNEDKDEEEEEDTCVYDEYKVVEDLDDILSKVDTEEYRIYLEYATKTEGFYVPFSPPTGPSSWWWPMIEEGAEFAVEHYNKNRAGPVVSSPFPSFLMLQERPTLLIVDGCLFCDGQLKFVSIRIVNIQTVAGVFFYITLAAENVASRDIIDYQTKLFRGINMKWEVLMFRKDPEIVVEMVERDMARLEPFFRNHDVY